MSNTFTYDFDTPAVKVKTSFNTGLFIDGKFVDGAEKKTIDVINPTNGNVITTIAEASAKDVDTAVLAARKAFETTWGLNCAGSERGILLNKLALLMERDSQELAALEALDNGKTFSWATNVDVAFSIATIKYYAGWADKIHGKTIETDEKKTRLHETRANWCLRTNHSLELPSFDVYLEARPSPRDRQLCRPKTIRAHAPHRHPHVRSCPGGRIPTRCRQRHHRLRTHRRSSHRRAHGYR